MGIKGPGKRWRGARHVFLAEKMHAPMVDQRGVTEWSLNRHFAYCAAFHDPTIKVAAKGDTVNCRCCLKKLAKHPQYANLLKSKFNIRLSGGLECSPR